MDLSGKNALVTGGAVRIGRAISLALASRGCGVVIHCNRSLPEAETLSAEIRSKGGRAWTVKTDLRSEQQCRGLMDFAVSEAGALHVLVNNAAVFHACTMRQLNEAALMDELWPNLLAPALLTRFFAEHVEAVGGSGGVVNLLDRRIAGMDAARVPYMLGKKGLAEITQMAALEYAPGISVNAVAPGPVLPPPGHSESYLQDRAGPVPMKLRIRPEDVAETVVFLLEHRFFTGQIIFVDGGQHLLNRSSLRAQTGPKQKE